LYQQAKAELSESLKKKYKEPTESSEEDMPQKVQPKKGMKVVKVLEKKKTVRDAKGDTWEVVDKRDKKAIEKPIDSDSNAGSELSFD
jgi:hypothetical protein